MVTSQKFTMRYGTTYVLSSQAQPRVVASCGGGSGGGGIGGLGGAGVVVVVVLGDWRVWGCSVCVRVCM